MTDSSEAHRMPDPLDAYRTPDRLKARIAMHERFGPNTPDLHDRVFDLLLSHLSGAVPLVPEDARVLEVGAGTGRMWQVARSRIPKGWELTLTDRSPGMLQALEKLNDQLGLGATISEADAMQLPFEDASFDVAFANHMLYHVPDPGTGISELSRVLEPGGVLIASTNGEGHMRQATDLVRPLAELDGGLELMGVSPLSFTCESGTELLAQHFNDVELHRYDDALAVTDTGVLLGYLRSLVHLPESVPDHVLSALHDWEDRVRATPLPLRVDRATGVFVARK